MASLFSILCISSVYLVSCSSCYCDLMGDGVVFYFVRDDGVAIEADTVVYEVVGRVWGEVFVVWAVYVGGEANFMRIV